MTTSSVLTRDNPVRIAAPLPWFLSCRSQTQWSFSSSPSASTAARKWQWLVPFHLSIHRRQQSLALRLIKVTRAILSAGRGSSQPDIARYRQARLPRGSYWSVFHPFHRQDRNRSQRAATDLRFPAGYSAVGRWSLWCRQSCECRNSSRITAKQLTGRPEDSSAKLRNAQRI